jgi:maltooligosyltrehalose trehalohydrolase
VYVHNHDQVGNRARGDRSPAYLTQHAQRLACGLLMLSPCIPLLFMGEEYAEARPFPFFCSFGDPDLIESVRRGRRAEFAAIEFRWGEDIPDPQDPATFESARLTWQWPDGTFHAQLRRLWADLLRARRRWPPLVDRRIASARLLNPAASERGTDWPAVLVVERGAGKSLLACANTTASCQPFPELELLDRTALLSTEEPAYGGRRDLAKPPADLHPYEMVVFGWKEWTR